MAIKRIGVDMDDFRLDTKSAFRQAADLRFGRVEFATVAGELSPSALSKSGRRHLARLAAGSGLQIEALVADMPGLQFDDPKTVQERVDRTCLVMELAADLCVPTVTAHVGKLFDESASSPSQLVTAALHQIGEVADATGVTYAIRPTADSGEQLAEVLKTVLCPGVGIGLDPASMVMHGVDPFSMFDHMADKITVAFARDGTVGSAERAGTETPLGEGDVDMLGALSRLDDADYARGIILRRTASANPIEDLRNDRRKLEAMLAMA